MNKDGIAISVEDKKVLVWGWVAVILSVAATVVAFQISLALAIATGILSGSAGLSMIILSIAKGRAWLKLADAEVLRRKTELTEAQTERWQLIDHVRRLTSGQD